MKLWAIVAILSLAVALYSLSTPRTIIVNKCLFDVPKITTQRA